MRGTFEVRCLITKLMKSRCCGVCSRAAEQLRADWASLNLLVVGSIPTRPTIQASADFCRSAREVCKLQKYSNFGCHGRLWRYIDSQAPVGVHSRGISQARGSLPQGAHPQ